MRPGGRSTEKLIAAARAEPNITLLEKHFAIDLITTGKLGFVSEDRVLGLYVLDEASGEVLTLRSDRVILATGGCGRVYLYTTNPEIATGDGVAMAWRAGAAIANMEFIQFHPTCLYHPKQRSLPHLRGHARRGRACSSDKDGRSSCSSYDPRGSLAPRDIVARAIDHEIKRTGGPCVYLDITQQAARLRQRAFPEHLRDLPRASASTSPSEPIPVVPAAHYQCGGVLHRREWRDLAARALRRRRSRLHRPARREPPGQQLAARSASSSRTARVDYHAAQAARSATRDGTSSYDIPAWESGDAQDVDELVVIYHNWDEIRRLMWDYVSIVRTNKRLQRAAARLRNLKREVQEFYWNFKVTSELLELRNLVETASLIVDCALRRQESRGLHYTLDYPEPDASHPPSDTVLRRY